MKHKQAVNLLAVAMAVSAAFGAAACAHSVHGEHVHTYSDAWTYDKEYHWHAATCEHTGETSDKAKHSFGESGTCSVCGYEKQPEVHSHTFSEAWTSDDENHWHVADCGHDAVEGMAAHSYENGKCSVCGHEHEQHSFLDGVCTVCGLTLVTSELRYEEVLGADGQTVTGYSVIGWADGVTDRTQLVIPAQHENKPVVAVGDSAFDVDDGDGDETLSLVYLPESVETLGEYAFYGCSGLKSVNLEKVKTLSKGAFYECTGLKSVTLGELELLGQYAFYGCASLRDARVEGVKTFDGEAFRNCASLERVEFGDGVTAIPAYTFYESGAVREIILGKAYSQPSEELTDGTFPEGLESIEVSGENATYSAEGGILYNKGKTELAFVPLAIKGKVKVADGVKEIKAVNWQFMNHAFITSITIPASVESVANDWVRKPFKGCSALVEVYDLAAAGISVEGDYGLSEGTVIHTSVSEASIVTDPDANGFVWRTDTSSLHVYFGRETQLVLPDGYEGKPYSVGARAFCSSTLETVTVSSKVTALGEECFDGSGSLQEIVIEEGLETIGAAAFRGCIALTKVTLPKSVKTIGAGAFANCTALTRADYAGTVSEWASIEFGNEMSNIFASAAEEAPTLYLGGAPLPEKIKIEGIEEVGNYAFYGTPVREVTIGQGVRKVGQNAFSYCTDLKTVILGKDVEYFYYAFTNTSVDTVFYEGAEETWDTLNNGNGGSRGVSGATVYFHSDAASESGNAWHYGEAGEPEIW